MDANAELPPTMKAVIKTRAGPMEQTLEVKDVPLPPKAKDLAPNHLLVKVAYCSLNPFDLKLPESPMGRFFLKGIPCLDYSGTVVGSTSPSFEPGQQVYGNTQPPNFGACAEYVLVQAEYCMPVPQGVSLQDAATLGTAALMAYQSIVPYIKDLPKDAKVLINGGSGGTGTFSIQIAKALGCHVTATCSGANVELCRSLGAVEVIDYKTTDLIPHLIRLGTHYDLILDTVFSPGAPLYWNSHHYLKAGGKYVTMALRIELGCFKDIAAIKFWPSTLGGGQRDFVISRRENRRADYERISQWMQEGKVKAVVEKVYPLEEVKEAFGRLRSGRVRGKVVVELP